MQDARLVSRTIDVLEALSEYKDGCTIKEITDNTHLNKSTVFRILNTLMHRGYVLKNTLSQQYQLSLRLYDLGNRAVPQNDLVSLARPTLENLSRTSHEAVHFAIQDGAQIFYLFKEVVSDNVVNIASSTGGHNYMYCTGLGKALLAHMTPEEVNDVWDHSKIIQYTENTITSLDRLMVELDAIRKCGYAMDRQEHEDGICCIADVIYDADSKVVAAISISTIYSRMTQDFITHNLPFLKQAAMNISHILGYPDDEEEIIDSLQDRVNT